ncbi:BEN domain-containing protein 3 isoform X1 [Microcaecilia unicolor]|uniref:BEN domain-containing protein 3 isoform X1 n=2 Tax=Microcaecilia unicolor TaxID=1415580 RepID=A0A6P7XRA0_9AMPH|nr:BEN domain-containing protein 3 isoform X1 [Microcaecilia unicolor]
MSSVEIVDDEEEEVTEVKSGSVKVEADLQDAVLDCSIMATATEEHLWEPPLSTGLTELSKRKQALLAGGGAGSEQGALPSVKKRRIIPESLLSCIKSRDVSSPTLGCLDQSSKVVSSSTMFLGDGDEPPSKITTTASYKKPLYGISHKITEKKIPPGPDQFAAYEVSSAGSPSPLRMLNDQRKRDSGGSAIVATETDPNIFTLIQKMFYTLNALSSNMSQLHSKVDLLSLEVSRIKRKVSPVESVAEFQPPPEYQLTSAELKQVLDQSVSAGDLACRLLVQLFPELFGDDEFGQGCSTCGFPGRKKLESLHLQLIRSYVEACYPSVKSTQVWQTECLPQVNDFFSRFWAQREMEGDQQQGIQQPTFYQTEEVDTVRFIEDKEQEEALSLDQNSVGMLDYTLDAQDLSDFLDEASSPGEFAVFLLHRLFPELFDQRKLAERYSCYGGSNKLPLDPHRLQMIRRYTEIYFPDMQEEEAWLQQCTQRIDDEMESIYVDSSDCEEVRDDCYDSSSLPDDVSVVKVEDGYEYERPGRRSKKIWLVPVDFEKIDFSPPDFEVPVPEYMLSKEQLRSIYESSLSIGNFASRLLVHLFPELFTQENLRKQYNCSGSLGKKQLDPVRIKLIRHYVQLLYPRARNDRVWMLEFVGKLDERCRRRDTEQRRTYQQQRKVHVPGPERRDFMSFELNPDRFRELLEGPPLPPERSSKDFCKIPLDELVVLPPDFPVPSVYLLSDKEVREIVQQSLSVGNFAARLLVRLFPELFTPENLRLQYNHSGACNKKQLDPVRLRLIRHYVEAVYPVEKMEEVWHYECIPSIDERCRRPNRKKCDILKKAKKAKK